MTPGRFFPSGARGLPDLPMIAVKFGISAPLSPIFVSYLPIMSLIL